MLLTIWSSRSKAVLHCPHFSQAEIAEEKLNNKVIKVTRQKTKKAIKIVRKNISHKEFVVVTKSLPKENVRDFILCHILFFHFIQ